MLTSRCVCAFFFNGTATTEIYTLSLHDALPISGGDTGADGEPSVRFRISGDREWRRTDSARSEEHTSELQSRLHLVCRLLLEKKKRTSYAKYPPNTRNTTKMEMSNFIRSLSPVP